MALRDPISAVVSLVIGVVFFILSSQYSGGAEIFPRAVAGIMIIASLLLLTRSVLQPRKAETLSAETRKGIAFVIAATLVYIVGVINVGFITSSLVFIPLVSYRLGVRNLAQIAATTVVFIAGLSALFVGAFGVPMPPELVLSIF